MIITWPVDYMNLVYLLDSFSFRTDKLIGIRPGSYRVALRNIDSRAYYSRRALASDRRSPYVCFHGWRDFIRLALVDGATRISTCYGKWRSIEEFDEALPIIAAHNVGSLVAPLTLPDLCTHERQNPPPVLARAVDVARKGAPHAL